jgi:UDP-N-acetyl-D-glucosamine dehydrogenase
MANLPELFSSRHATIGIIGLGYVGLPLSIAAAKHGFPVVGFDVDAAKIELLHAHQSYIHHVSSERLAKLIRPALNPITPGTLHPTTDFSQLRQCDAILICVPTPLTTNREPDLSYVIQTAKTISHHLRREQLVVLESTSYPGTTDEVVRPTLETGGLQAGRDFYLAFSPERVDPSNSSHEVTDIPKVVGGVTEECGRVAKAFYLELTGKVKLVSNARIAEATKLLENAFRCVNIALVNELKVNFDPMGIDVWDVIEAASTKPFGYMPFYPGPGVGGHCIPVDPLYLTWKMREYNMTPRLIEVAAEVNRAMPGFILEKITDEFNRRSRSLRGARILVLGVSYKPDVDDTRESPALGLIELLQRKGVEVQYNDPYVPVLNRSRQYDFGLRSVQLNSETLGSADAIVITTDHKVYEYDSIVSSSRLVIDTRNATRNVLKWRDRIIRA